MDVPLDAAQIDDLYRETAAPMLAFLTRRTWEPEVAVDLLAETFAVAIAERARFRGRTQAEAVAWLYGIARHQLARWYRQGAIERRAMARMGVERRELTEAEHERIVELGGLAARRDQVRAELDTLGAGLREAVRLRIVEELPYDEVAATLGVSEQTARARVSRALRTLGERLGEQEVVDA